MQPDDLKALRKELGCTAKELAHALGLEQREVIAWEKGELFPTKQFIDRMNVLRSKGKAAFPKASKGGDPLKGLADPEVWKLFRKILTQPKLRKDMSELAKNYPDPAEDDE